MSYFLKQTNTPRGLYYQVYDGKYSPEKGYAVHKSIKIIGYHNDLLKEGISDPYAYAKNIVEQMEKERKELLYNQKLKKISEESPLKNIGYLIPLSLLEKLDIKKDFSYLTFGSKIKYSLYNVYYALIAARIIAPCSNHKAYEETIPSLIQNFNLSYDSLLDGLNIIGENYSSVIEILNMHYQKFYKRKTNNVYFDCTNYYFEIDKPFEDKQKGPSKENRKEPIIGMALLLDEDQIPLSMHMYPGNQSEKPEIRKIINKMKSTNKIKGRTIQIADKGLNCSRNIYEALKENDGYIYSQSVKKLSSLEMKWIDIQNQYKETKENGEIIFKIKSCVDKYSYSFNDENNQKCSFSVTQKRIVYWSKDLEEKHKLEINNEIDKLHKAALSTIKRKDLGDLAKYIKLTSITEDGEINSNNIAVLINHEKIKEDLKYCGYNTIITSEINMSEEKILNAYRNLWRIEESFKILKTNLVARPIYVSKKETIYGHFLICYSALFLMRILELKILKDQIPANTLFDFCKKFNVVKGDNNYINLLTKKEKEHQIFDLFDVHLDNYYLTEKDIQKFLKIKI